MGKKNGVTREKYEILNFTFFFFKKEVLVGWLMARALSFVARALVTI